MIVRICPITGGSETRMTRSSFEAMCRDKMAEGNPYCVEQCRGLTTPPELEYIELTTEKVMPRMKGTCEQCGKDDVSWLKNCHGKKCCPTCDLLRRGVKNHRELVQSMFAEFHGAMVSGGSTKENREAPMEEVGTVYMARLREILGGKKTDSVITLASECVGRVAELEAVTDAQEAEIAALRKTSHIPKATTAPPTGMASAIETACTAVRDFLLAKNASYGNSAAEPVRIFSQADPLEQINVRIDDKLSRLIRGSSYPGDDDERDLLGYLVLKQAVRMYREEMEKVAA